MEDYRTKLKIDNLFIAVSCSILILFSILMTLAEAGYIPFLTPVTGDSHWQSMWRGFCCGAAFGILALMIAFLIRNLLALRSEAQMKKLYVKEHDERTIQIWTQARAKAFQAFVLLGLAAGVVSGYFSATVSITILACVTTASLLGLLMKLYYNIKL